jgi:hypothetical protein
MLISLFSQVGMYQFNVTPPTTLPDTVVHGSPLYAMVHPGAADAAHTNFAVTVPPHPTALSFIEAQIALADVYGNPIPASAPGQSDTKLVVVQGTRHSCELQSSYSNQQLLL